LKNFTVPVFMVVGKEKKRGCHSRGKKNWCL